MGDYSNASTYLGWIEGEVNPEGVEEASYLYLIQSPRLFYCSVVALYGITP